MFEFREKSLGNFQSVHPDLVKVAKYAITISPVDFGVFEGVRSLEKEQDNINKGVSKLSDPRHCKHCIQLDGSGHALDLVPFIDGKYNWDWNAIYNIARSMQISAIKLGVKIKWGAVWDRSLNSLTSNMESEVKAYCARHPGKDFEDGPHFELMEN